MHTENRTKLLILDIDETLVYAAEAPLGRRADFVVGSYHVYRRPGVENFLMACLGRFTVAIWTSSSTAYAAEVTQALFAEPEQLAFVWASEKCTPAYDIETGESISGKNLRKVKQKGYSLASVIAVDDSPEKWGKSYGNLVQVRPFFGSPEDDELQRLLPYLETLCEVPDVRTVEKRRWRGEVT